MRYLGLDYGSKTVGIALSDPNGTIAYGLEIVFRDNEESLKKTIKRIDAIIKEYGVETIVIGYPRNMDGSEGHRCHKTVEFKDRLSRNFKKMPLVLWDERLSTVGATRNLYEAGLNSKKQKDIIDKMAAVFILQGYLESLAHK